MSARLFGCVGGLFGAVGVSMLAAGRHIFSATMDERAMQRLHTAAEFLLWHGLLLMIIAACVHAATAKSHWNRAGWLVVIGTLLFCGSLTGLSFGLPTWLAHIAPAGGLCLIAGWLLCALAAWKQSSARAA